MKLISIVFAFCLLLSGCAPSLSPVGSWDYTITGTPNGDYAGVMTVTKSSTGYTAVLNSQGNAIPFTKFVYDPKTKKSTGDFDYQGMPIQFDAIVAKDGMNGNMSVSDSQFPFKATRKSK